MNVLYVEDDQKLINGIQNTYKNLMQITGACTVADAKYLVQKYKFDILLVNLNLPDCSSIDVICKSLSCDSPIIIVSKELTLDLIKRGSELGVADFILKRNLDNMNLPSHIEFVLAKCKKIITKSKTSFDNIDLIKKYICCADALAKF